MDFQISLQIAAIISSAILIGSLARYSGSISYVRNRVSTPTLRALIFFGAACATLGGIAISSVFFEGTIGARFWIVMFFVFLINAQMQIGTENKYAHYGTYAVAVAATSWAIVVALGTPTEISPALSMALIITFSVALLISLWLLYDSPSPFTGGMFVLLIAFLGSWYSIITELVFVSPQYFLLAFLPIILSSSILATMLQPWRQMITVFTVSMAILVATSVIPAAVISGQFEIWFFVIFSTFVALAAIGSIDFFMQQAIDSKARIPVLISVTLVCIAMIAVNHGVFWADLTDTGVQDEALTFIEWIFGVIGASTFVLAGVFSTTTREYQRISRHIMVVFSGVMITLGHDYIRMGRWVYNDLFIVLACFLVIGVIAYIQVARRLSKSGAITAARNFIAFMFAALGASIVAIASDNLPFPVAIILLAVTGIMLIYSSPRRFSLGGSNSQKQ